ncbi:B-4DMT family transporter [[Mycobacterium] holstebronense]|uniref:B-4DMT family transporter n=1 Tax=[Mycobacterium] holstebronense TaxID=3064288 RepID=A0ABN9NEN2_9MYCO|nr:B-4DMT family transporter [Mycolicibacter sp. MU0102]CAJ1505094.1 B-4DMT family transporter [Mycolicibacter sp. MU0102]
MSKWFLRGLVFAALMVVIRLIQGVLINAFEAQAGLISLALMILFAIAVFVWGRSDGREDAKATADPDRRADLAMTWLGAGLVAGLLSGFVSWLIGQVDKALYISTFFNELTSFAAFTALLVFVVAVAAVALGRRAIDKEYEKHPERRPVPAAAESQPATDVFATVGAPALAAEETGAVQTEAAAPAPDATLAGPSAGFTTEEFPADTDATTEFPVIEDNGGAEAQSDSAVSETESSEDSASDDSTK